MEEKKIPSGIVVTHEVWQATHPQSSAPDSSAAVRSAMAFAEKAAASVRSMNEALNHGRKKAPPVVFSAEMRATLSQWRMPQLIAMGASTGGTETLAEILHHLEPPLPPIAIVQHIPQLFSRLFAERLDRECSLSVQEAADGDVLQRDHVYIAPGGKHMGLKRAGGLLVLECQQGPPINSVCPSADVLFQTAAEELGSAVLGVILTGIGKDGADGMLSLRKTGAHTLGQDEASSIIYGMPRAAYESGAVEVQLNLRDMPEAIKIIAQK